MVGTSVGVSAGASVGVSTGVSVGVSVGASVGSSAGVSAGASAGVSAGASAGSSSGVSEAAAIPASETSYIDNALASSANTAAGAILKVRAPDKSKASTCFFRIINPPRKTSIHKINKKVI